MKNLIKEQYRTYFLLACRVLIAWTLARYGWSKLTDHQFGVNEKTLQTPLKDIDLFRLSWYLADHEPFKSFIGYSQIVTACLLLFHRTVIIGCLVSIPIWLNILVWDWTFMQGMAWAFTFRISFYLLLTFLIVYEQKQIVFPAMAKITQVRPMPSAYPYWLYLTLPIAAFVIELIGAIPTLLFNLIRMSMA